MFAGCPASLALAGYAASCEGASAGWPPCHASRCASVRAPPPVRVQFISILVAVAFKFCGRQRDFESFEDNENGGNAQGGKAGNSSIQVCRRPTTSL